MAEKVYLPPGEMTIVRGEDGEIVGYIWEPKEDRKLSKKLIWLVIVNGGVPGMPGVPASAHDSREKAEAAAAKSWREGSYEIEMFEVE